MDIYNDNIQCVLSVGMRCLTEWYLKVLNYKKFSSPLDGANLITIDNIIDLLKNKIDYNNFIHSELINNSNIHKLNKKHGNRTILKCYFNENNLLINSSLPIVLLIGFE